MTKQEAERLNHICRAHPVFMLDEHGHVALSVSSIEYDDGVITVLGPGRDGLDIKAPAYEVKANRFVRTKPALD